MLAVHVVSHAIGIMPCFVDTRVYLQVSASSQGCISFRATISLISPGVLILEDLEPMNIDIRQASVFADPATGRCCLDCVHQIYWEPWYSCSGCVCIIG